MCASDYFVMRDAMMETYNVFITVLHSGVSSLCFSHILLGPHMLGGECMCGLF
jgi:hypothetical protein